jgi:hypothetical protein
LPEFKDVKEFVRENYYKDQARQLQQKAVSKAKVDILDSKTMLKDVASRLGVKLIETEFIKKGDKIKDLSKDSPLLNKLFLLSDKKQVLQDMHGDEYYLATLENVQKFDEKLFKEKSQDIKNNEALRGARRQANAFVASSLRNAKIDIDKKALSLYKSNQSKDM